MLNVQSEC